MILTLQVMKSKGVVQNLSILKDFLGYQACELFSAPPYTKYFSKVCVPYPTDLEVVSYLMHHQSCVAVCTTLQSSFTSRTPLKLR